MAMFFSDGFDSYSSTASLLNRWSSVGSPWVWDPVAGRRGGGAIVASGAAATTAISSFRDAVALVSAQAVHFFGFWMKLSAAPAANTILYTLFTRNEDTMSIRVNTTGTLSGLSTSGGVYATGATNVADDAWHWIEFRIQKAIATQTCFVDGVSQWSVAVSNVTLQPESYFSFFSMPNRTLTIDDVIGYNDSAGYPQTANFPIGLSIITTIRPSADVEADFSRSSGVSNFSLVNEQSLDVNNWVEGFNALDMDLYEYDDILFSPTPTRIHTLMVTSALMDPKIGSKTFSNVARSHATQGNGTTLFVPIGDAIFYQSSFPLDPDTGGQWFEGTINSAVFGLRVVS
jgi:hypothetical protein